MIEGTVRVRLAQVVRGVMVLLITRLLTGEAVQYHLGNSSLSWDFKDSSCFRVLQPLAKAKPVPLESEWLGMRLNFPSRSDICSWPSPCSRALGASDRPIMWLASLCHFSSDKKKMIGSTSRIVGGWIYIPLCPSPRPESGFYIEGPLNIFPSGIIQAAQDDKPSEQPCQTLP